MNEIFSEDSIISSSSDSDNDEDIKYLEASLVSEDRVKKKRRLKKRPRRQDIINSNIVTMRETEIDQISSMLSKLSPRTIRDVVGQYLVSQPQATALHHVNAWYSHWRHQIIINNSKNKAPLSSCSSPYKTKPQVALTTNLQQLKKLYISNKKFEKSDKRSMAFCLYRNFPKYSISVLK